MSPHSLTRRPGLSVSQFRIQVAVFADGRRSWHAEQAIKEYQHLFYPDGNSTGDHLLSDEQIYVRDSILEDAYRNLAQAEMDHVEIQCDHDERRERFKAIYGCEPTVKDISRVCLYRHSKQYRIAIESSMQSYETYIEQALGVKQEDKGST